MIDVFWWSAEEPSTIDLTLLEVVYGFMATETFCTRCGCILGRRLQVKVSPTLCNSARWQVSVRTRCRGHRRHRHEAAVGRSTSGLLLGPFRTPDIAISQPGRR